LPLLAVLALAGCDPKLNGPPPGDDDGPDDIPDLTVTPEAQAIGNVIALHAEILRAGASVAAEFDVAPVAGLARGIMPAGCWDLTEASAAPPQWDLRLDGCIDGHGTEYRGGGQFEQELENSGFGFDPWYDLDLIRATNTENDNYNHDVHSGTLGFTILRPSGTVTGVGVDRYLRHNVRSEIVTFTYTATFTGSLDGLPEYPDAGSTVRVVWDSVGVIDVAFAGGATATWPMQGVLYQVALDTGVTAVSSCNKGPIAEAPAASPARS
jgi:hypothetical protein